MEGSKNNQSSKIKNNKDFDKETLLKGATTRQLLIWKAKCNGCDGQYSPYNPHDPNAIFLTTEEIEAELCTREHIPNKSERKKKRRQAAVKSKDRGRSTHKRKMVRF